jgi:hypothetical protein
MVRGAALRCAVLRCAEGLPASQQLKSLHKSLVAELTSQAPFWPTLSLTHLRRFRWTLTAVGDSWTEPTAGLVVRHLGSSGGSAAISVCRIGGAETAASCAALRDNDCNGLVGNADPTCAFLAAAKARLVAAANRIRRKPSKVITNTALAPKRPTAPAPKRRPPKSAR